MTTDITTTSGYLQYLPAIFQEDADQQHGLFIGRFLLAFEKVLTGLRDVNDPGLEEILDGIFDRDTGALLQAGVHRYFDPGPDQPDYARAPAEFLTWLASWVALTLRADWDAKEQRRFLSQIVPLYRLRGTKAGLEKMLKTYTDMGVEILEDDKQPYFFQVKMVFTKLEPALFERKKRIALAIIDQEKPAHTYYKFAPSTPTMQIGISSRVGIDTLLGS